MKLDKRQLRSSVVSRYFLSTSALVPVLSLVLVTFSHRCASMAPPPIPTQRATNRFITHTMCPFAHKAWLALEVANIPYRMEEIGLYGPGGKPDWFWKLNPRGTVPVLVVKSPSEKRDIILTDSDDILEYLHDQINNNCCSTSVEKIRGFVNEQLLPSGKQAVMQGQKQKLKETLKNMEAEYFEPNESLFLAGDAVSIADCHAFPFLWRLRQEFDDIIEPGNHPGLCHWLERCESLPQFKKTVRRSWWWWW